MDRTRSVGRAAGVRRRARRGDEHRWPARLRGPGAAHQIASAYGARAATITAFPTYLMVTMGRGEPATIELTTALIGSPRLDQVASLDRLLQQAERGGMSPGRRAAPARGDPRLAAAVRASGQASRATPCWRRGSVWSCIRRRSRSPLRRSSVRSWDPAHAGSGPTDAAADDARDRRVRGVGTQRPGGQGRDLRPRDATHGGLTRHLLAGRRPDHRGARTGGRTDDLGRQPPGRRRRAAGALAFGILAGIEAVGISSSRVLFGTEALLGEWSRWAGVLVFTIGVVVADSAPPGRSPACSWCCTRRGPARSWRTPCSAATSAALSAPR